MPEEREVNVKQIRMGLGEAILRLIHVEGQYMTQTGITEDLVAERKMIVAALNQYQLDLGFDCDGDGLADVSPEGKVPEVPNQRPAASTPVFATATSCCRILPLNVEPERKRPRSSRSRG